MNKQDLSEAKTRFEQDGYVIFRKVIDSELLAEANEHVAWLYKRYPDLRPEHFHHPLMRDDAFWVRMVTDPALLDIATAFLGPDVACFTAHYICKPPVDGHAVLWHQDGAYWNLSPMNALTLWVAIDRSGPDNGCLRMIPGSHKHPIWPTRLRDDVPNMLASSVNAGLPWSQEDAVEICLEPGDVSIHHPHIIHGSEANRSAHRRCGLDIGYIPADTQILNEGLYLNPILVAGQGGKAQQYRPWPMFDVEQTIAFRGMKTGMRTLPCTTHPMTM